MPIYVVALDSELSIESQSELRALFTRDSNFLIPFQVIDDLLFVQGNEFYIEALWRVDLRNLPYVLYPNRFPTLLSEIERNLSADVMARLRLKNGSSISVNAFAIMNCGRLLKDHEFAKEIAALKENPLSRAAENRVLN